MPGATRDISYAETIEGRLARAAVRLVEDVTGRRSLSRRAVGYEEELACGAEFWSLMAARYGLDPVLGGAGLAAIPVSGPVVVVANHPFGVLDGLMMGLILQRARGAGFRILAHEVFSRARELEDVILPVDFAGTSEAARRTIATRKAAQAFLAAGGAVGVFPGGTVSTAARPFGRAMDPEWRRFTAKMVARSGATVVPVFFDGQNSRLFQLASHVSVPLRMGLLLNEFRARVDRPVQAIIGAPIPPATLAPFYADPKSMMDFLRERTYALSPTPVDWRATGYDFEERHKA
jgi:putative hemolysin